MSAMSTLINRATRVWDRINKRPKQKAVDMTDPKVAAEVDKQKQVARNRAKRRRQGRL